MKRQLIIIMILTWCLYTTLSIAKTITISSGNISISSGFLVVGETPIEWDPSGDIMYWDASNDVVSWD